MKSLVITSIAKSLTPTLKTILDTAQKSEVACYLVLDKKSGPLRHRSTRVLDCDMQKELGFQLTAKLPWNSYSRKNLGYLMAIHNESEWIIETDDDNIPSEEFFNLETRLCDTVRRIKDLGWVNFYPLFGNDEVWPRGLPLRQVKIANPNPTFELTRLRATQAPIFQVIADGDPDVDAIFRLTRDLPQFFQAGLPVYVGPNCVAPFNSQATWWHKSIAPLAYFPSLISWRVADIWRSLIAQRILQCRDQGVLFFGPLVKQERNPHDLIRDFEEELLCYTHTDVTWEYLHEIPKEQLQNSLEDALLACYLKLIEKKMIPKNELILLQSWLEDCQKSTS